MVLLKECKIVYAIVLLNAQRSSKGNRSWRSRYFIQWFDWRHKGVLKRLDHEKSKVLEIVWFRM